MFVKFLAREYFRYLLLILLLATQAHKLTTSSLVGTWYRGKTGLNTRRHITDYRNMMERKDKKTTSAT